MMNRSSPVKRDQDIQPKRTVEKNDKNKEVIVKGAIIKEDKTRIIQKQKVKEMEIEI